MSLSHALLGLINYRPFTGYNLKTTFDKSIHFFWNAPLPHIYRTLKQMEKDGWIISTIEPQIGKPNRIVYQITERGRKELFRWLNEPTDISQSREPTLVKIFFGNQMPREKLKDHLKNWREYHASLLIQYEKEATDIIQRDSAQKGSASDAFYWGLTLDFGRCYAQMVVEWCDRVLKSLSTVQEKGKKKRPRGKTVKN